MRAGCQNDDQAPEGAGAWWRGEQVLLVLCEGCCSKDLNLAHWVCHLKEEAEACLEKHWEKNSKTEKCFNQMLAEFIRFLIGYYRTFKG